MAAIAPGFGRRGKSMKTLSRYVAKTVFFSIAAVLAVVVAFDVMAAIIDGVGDLGGNYAFFDVLVYVFTTLPGRIYQNIPFSALIGCLVGLGLLASNTELVVMRAAGVSLLRIVAFVLRPVILFIVLAGLLGEYAVPYTEQLAEGRRAILLGESSPAGGGLWSRENDEFIHVNAVFPSGRLYGVSRYRFADEGEMKLKEVSFATSAEFLGNRWKEESVVVTVFGDNATSVEQFETRIWHSDLSPGLLRLGLMEADSLPMADLYQYARYLEQQDQGASRHWLAFWNKALQPLITLSLVLVAVSFIFGPLRQSTTGLRIFAGVVTGIVFSTSQDLLGPASLVYGFSPFWAVLAPVLLSMVFGLLLLRRAG